MNKLTSIISTFNKEESLKFIRYASIYYEETFQAPSILKWILSINENQALTHLTLDEIYNLSDQNIKKQSFKNIISQLGNIAHEYIAWIQWKSNQQICNTSKLVACANRNLPDYYLKLHDKLLYAGKETPIDIFNEYYKTIALYYDYNFHISESKDNYSSLFKDLIQTFKTGVSKVAQSLMVELKNREKLMENENWRQESEFFDLLYENPTDIIEITNLLLLLSEGENDDSYYALLEILYNNHSQKLSHYLRFTILMYCTIYLNGIIKHGYIERVEELLILYEYGLEHKILTPSESIDTRTYLNVIGTFSKLANPKKTREIIHKYTNKVDYADIKMMKQMATAILDFNTGNFEKVINTLRGFEPIGFQMKLKARWLHLKAIIEVQYKYPSALLGQISIFKRYIKVNKDQINMPTYIGLQTTIQAAVMVIQKKNKLDIKNTIDESQYVFEKKWILEFMERSNN